ncbi:hypothetical protein [Roseibacillus ishigakijimensis]|uniref:F5/8 type C domain-containing protein n=1 Tax=Roseibacillus ishigakijimensis TaxID=454146 RepID=A0A934RR60_9BACT|nr:hypothetical protein [Roseibacillus ishigakijimensis]MBK1833544.1 hypothetical protein [Roseibacillus ishigakijimensis]
MKTAARLIATLLALATCPLTARIISPDGSAYLSVSAHPVLRADYAAGNLFDQYLTVNQDPGDDNDSGRAWASDFDLTTAVVEFELAQSHSVEGFAYSQRQYLINDANDKFTAVDIWVSETTAYSATAYSATAAPADAPRFSNIPLRTDATDQFLLYRLPEAIEGRYFRFAFKRPFNSEGVAGGTELRLVTDLPTIATPADPAIISPDGSLYTHVVASAELNGNYSADKLFDQNLLPGDDPGSNSDAGRAWAIQSGQEVGTLSFQLDQPYLVSSLVYSQRQFQVYNFNDKVRTLEIWASGSSPLTSEPDRAPDATLTLNEELTDRFIDYPLPNTLRGRYFFLKFHAAPGDGIIGGTELRLAGSPAAEAAPLAITSLVRGATALDLELTVPAPGNFLLQYSHTLAPDSWQPVENGRFQAEFPHIHLRDREPGNLQPADGKVFYRVIAN